jgi:hypothetical protein
MDIALLISIVALFISIISIWKSYFAKFKLVTTVGNLGIRIFPLQHKKEKWYLPTIDIPISLTNEGARIGKVLGLRILIHFLDSPKKNDFQEIYPRWEVDSKKFNSLGNDFDGLEESTQMDWMPFILLPKQTVTKHIIFRERWDSMFVFEKVTFELEVFTNTTRKWKKVAKWKGTLENTIWSKKIEEVSSFIFFEEDSKLPDS